MDILTCVTMDIHTLEDSEVTNLLKFLVRECDRRFIDYQEAIEEVEQEIEAEFYNEMEQDYDYHHEDEMGW